MAVLGIGFSPQPASNQLSPDIGGTAYAHPVQRYSWLARAADAASLVFSQQVANILVALLTPASTVALVMGLWRVSTDLGWAGAFLITGGLFSHWQIWIALSIALKMLSSTLIAWGATTGKISQENRSLF
jgi:hypothetical protein